MRKLATGFVIFLAIFIILGVNHSVVTTRNVLALPPEENQANPSATVTIKIEDPIQQAFCSAQVCGEAGWQQWIMVTPESSWQADELVMLDQILTAVIDSLNQQGLDGHALLKGYRFRRQPGEYLVDRPSNITVVNHTTQEIALADAAFKRLHGFYIIHELGHVVDQRTGRQLSATFHALIGSNQQNQTTADGFWLNLHAQNDLEEATADAFALWVMSTSAPDYRPVFAYTPQTTKYEGITATMSASLDTLTLP